MNSVVVTQKKVFDVVGTDTTSFLIYLTSKRPLFYDGLQSTYCFEALTPMDPSASCNYPPLSWISTSVAGELAANPGAGAYSGTPSDPLVTFFRPSYILYNSLGRNLGNEGTVFHEALHGMTGRQDEQILENLGFAAFEQPSCAISVYIEQRVLSQSWGLDGAAQACPVVGGLPK